MTSPSDMATSYKELELLILRWAEARKIIPNSTPMAQACKTAEELSELLKALNRGDLEEAADAYGDLVVTLVIGADLAGLDLVQCLGKAYDTIKDRRGHLTPDGIFVKEAA